MEPVGSKIMMTSTCLETSAPYAVFGPPTATKLTSSGLMPALSNIQFVYTSVAAPRAVTPIFLPLKSCM